MGGGLRILLLAAALFSLVSLCLAQSNNEAIECPLPDNPTSVTEQECIQYSACEWSSTSQVCHMRNNDEAGYQYASGPLFNEKGFHVPLVKNNDSVTMYGADIASLTMMVEYHEDYHVQIKIVDTNNPRYEVPIPIFLPDNSGASPLLNVATGNQGDNLVLNVTRTSSGMTVFRTIGPITYEDQFIQFSVKLASEYVYGFGENSHSSLKRSFSPRSTSPIFARDQPVGSKETNHYGSFPYFVNIEDDEGNTHSVLLMNSNAMEYSTFELPDGSPALTIRSIGGIIDLHIFAGPTPEDVNIQYTSMIGNPNFPPYWSLGFQLSRWGYNSTSKVRELRDRMRTAGIPQDVQTFDIDYMDVRKDFTYDPVNFGDLPELIAELRSENIRTTVILDPALVANSTDYQPYIRGRAADAFISWLSPDLIPDDQPSDADDYVVGYVWPEEKVVFPDFFNPATKSWWSDEISLFRQEIPFDALWIDMNEPANFGTNLDRPFNWPANEENWSLKCPDNKWDSPPYPTKAATEDLNDSKRLSDKTICMSSLQTDGSQNYTHYDIHNLYGYSETVATYEAIKNLNPGIRPVVLSRSTFFGSGRYAVHWLGDNSATWEQMRDSIIGLIEFAMFGIPMAGADICGFFNEPSMELCARWMQLGAFYPFSRNHNTDQTADQDPAMWPEVASISKDILLTRYRYLPYLYSLFHNAHMSGETVIRPLFNVFPSDTSVRDISDQFFWGDAVMIAPVLYEGATSRSVYFPGGRWYDLETGVEEAIGPISKNISAPLEKIPVYVRAGRIIPFQEPGLTTDESRLNDFGLLVALDSAEIATGEVFWDDGQLDHIMSETYLSSVIFASDEMVMTNKFSDEAAAGVNLGTIKVIGFPKQPVGISVNGNDITTFTYDAATQVMVMTVNVPLMNDLKILLNYQNPTSAP